MKIIEQSCQWISPPPINTMQLIERAGRTCYKSEDKITPESAQKFVAQILKSGHESVIEHVSASMLFVTDRGVTHEIVRHRLASYSQESTRYCNYGKADEITVVRPTWWSDTEDLAAMATWTKSMTEAESAYLTLIYLGWKAQQARTVLPNSLKTEIVMTANMREWRHFFRLRCSKAAHPQMRDLALKALEMFRSCVSELFVDIQTA